MVPTVGVHDDASGKKSSGLQKHFRHLVNETASKHKFLRSLHRSSSSREGSGNLQPSTSNGLPEQATSDAAPEQPQVAARTRSRKAAAVSASPVKQQAGNRRSARGRLSREAAHVKEEDHQDCIDGDALPELPESLGVALGDANGDPVAASSHNQSALKPQDEVNDELQDATEDPGTLQADPDALLQDSMQAVDTSNAQNAEASRAENSEPVSVPLSEPLFNCPSNTASCTGHSGTVNEVLSILAGSIDEAAATELVAKAKGNLAAAINLFYDSTDAPVNRNSVQQPTSSAETAPVSDMSANISAASSRAAVGNGSTSKPSKQASQPPVVKQKKGSKRAASNADAGQAKGVVKKAKSVPQSGQRSIATFFGGQNASKQHQVKEEEVHIKDEEVQDLTSEDDVVFIKAEDDAEHDTVMAPGGHTGRFADGVKQAAAAAVDNDMHADAAVKLDPDVGSIRIKTEAAESAILDSLPVKQEAGAGQSGFGHVKQEPADPPPHSQHQSDVCHQSNNDSQSQPHAQPVHPFFGALHSKSASKGSGAPKKPLPAPAPNPTPTPHVPAVKPEQGAQTGDDQPSSTSKRTFVNPFQKAKSQAEEKDVPADAVLLSVADYKPVQMALWEAGQATPYRHISRAFQAMESTTKRLRIGDAIANMFRSILALSPGIRLTFAQCRC